MSQSTKSSLPIMAGRMGAILMLAALAGVCEARSLDNDASQDSAVIPSPNQEFNDADEFIGRDIQRTNSVTSSASRATSFPMASMEPQEQASNEASVPVYVSPFERSERSATIAALTPPKTNFDDHQESSHAPPNYAPRPAATATDLKTSASYGK